VAIEHSDQPGTLVLHESPKSYLWTQKVLATDIHPQLTCICDAMFLHDDVQMFMTQQA